VTQIFEHFEGTLSGPESVVEVVEYDPEGSSSSHVLPSTDAALAAAVQTIRGSGHRAATQAIVLFSNGTDSVSDAGLGQKLARLGIRVLAIGRPPDATSSNPTARQRLAALREIAFESKGSYYEVDPRLGGLAVRNRILNAANRLRFGAPICEFASSSPSGRYEIDVEAGSRSLQLLLCDERRAGLQISLKNPNGDTHEIEDRHAESMQNGQYAVSVPSPDAGTWRVTVDKPSGSGPAQHILAAYSDNPKIHIGVSGAERAYDVGEQVELRVVVGTPMPVVGLTPEVRVVKPSGVALEPPPESEPLPGGAYLVSFRAGAPGPYEVVIHIRNESQAEPAGEPGPAGEISEIPAFTRSKRFQVHVRE